MDIRIINGEGQVINVSRMHIIARNVFLVGLTEDMEKEILIERCGSKEEALAYLDAVKEAIKAGQEEEVASVLIDLECPQESGHCGNEFVKAKDLECPKVDESEEGE